MRRIPSRHRDEYEHFLSFVGVTVSGDPVRYPVDSPLPEPALRFIATLRQAAASRS
ncbi:hypothetical protein M0722_16250 [Microbacterium sp. KSW4-16]|uniref:hypothetical protein n=1 Tax=Microbacterium aurugineum TaxID=2851642 RepID=UPI0020C11935|nr:hypothetical protein [Microbacterium aurugineum]MCK8468748.1 hypothetical protein [Microbacterium aurugineum]